MERKLPSNRIVDQRKVDEYLVHPTNSRGKNAFFLALGFGPSDGDALASNLLKLAEEGLVTNIVSTIKGTKYEVSGTISSNHPNLPGAAGISVWQQDTGQDIARLITAYPDSEVV